ncbi:hypothetical protein [Burkholderia sp. BCC0097]|nr:hypothetical protein [Burkholderia sp. BCC0097]
MKTEDVFDGNFRGKLGADHAPFLVKIFESKGEPLSFTVRS